MPQQLVDDDPLLTVDEAMAVANNLYEGRGTIPTGPSPVQARGGTQSDLFNPLARDSRGRLLRPGTPDVVPPPPSTEPVLPRPAFDPNAPNFGGVRRMAPEEAAGAWAATRKRTALAELEQQHALQVDRDREFTKNLLANTRVKDAAKAVSAAIRFQGMRDFERDIEKAVAAGLSREQAAIQAISRRAPHMFYDAPSQGFDAAALAQAGRVTVPRTGERPLTVTASGSLVAPPLEPSTTVEEVNGVKRIKTRGGETAKQVTKTAAEAEGLPVGGKREMDYIRGRIDDLTPIPGFEKTMTPADKALLDSYQTLLAELETKYGMRAPAAPTPTAASGSNVVGRVTRGPDGKPIFNWLK